ncbi:MAG: endonuclease NucS domain-containing protein [Dehalococcoidia bacterium]
MATTPPVWQMIEQAIEALDGRASNIQIRDWVLDHYLAANRNTVNTQINILTVNSPSRVHLPENSKPRAATDPRYDLLYRVGRGEMELYDPTRHGAWEIRKGADGALEVGRAGKAPEPSALEAEFPAASRTIVEGTDSGAAQDFLFSLERHLRDVLAANLRSLDLPGAPLSIFTDDAGQSGVEYPTGVGPIDILAVDGDGNFVVFELKLGRGPDAAVGQLARYMGWVRRNLAGDRSVRGAIVAKTVDEKLRYAASILPDVSLFEYSVSFTLQPADEVR